ncbi:hypothetical protein [Photobacterium damselae]|uniref:hypothetical protein n=1 Tax=Photobacterium damselae TaxID=38293 RepID=UPI0030F47DF7
MNSINVVELLPQFIEKSIYPVAVRDLNGKQLMSNAAWLSIVRIEDGIKLSDINLEEPFIQTNLASCKIFDSLVTTSSIVINEVFDFKRYLALRAPVIFNYQQCILIQAIPL